jgi:hypothetical protein
MWEFPTGLYVCFIFLAFTIYFVTPLSDAPDYHPQNILRSNGCWVVSQDEKIGGHVLHDEN